MTARHASQLKALRYRAKRDVDHGIVLSPFSDRCIGKKINYLMSYDCGNVGYITSGGPGRSPLLTVDGLHTRFSARNLMGLKP